MFQFGIDHLTIPRAIALLEGKERGSLSQAARSQISRSEAHVLRVASGDDAVYGINTGFGPLCSTIISPGDTRELQKRILISHSVGVGDPISRDLSRLMLILKIHSLAKGYSGISLEILERIMWHLEEDIIPVVPEQGSVGASGDLAPLSHLFLPLIGEGEVWVENKIMPAAEILSQYGRSPLHPGPKAGLALINGTQFIAAHAVMLVWRMQASLSQADLIGGMMVEGLLGSKMPFHPSLHETRPFSGNKHVASRLYRFLKDSEINTSHLDCNRVQDPYSLRCMPQVHGASRNAWVHLKESVEIEMNSVTDNPVIVSEDLIISGGNFHGQPLALPIDYACLAAAELGSISDRRTYLSLEGKVAQTPKLLMENTGVNSGFMILQYTSAALVSENKGLCFPSSADSIPTSLGQEDHVSMGSIGGRKALRVLQNLSRILAVEWICAAQAMEFKRPLTSSKVLERAHEILRSRVSFAEEDRIFSKDILAAEELLNQRALLSADSESLSDPLSSNYEFA